MPSLHVDVLINIMSPVSPIQIRDACIFMLLSSTHHIFAHLFDIISMSAIKTGLSVQNSSPEEEEEEKLKWCIFLTVQFVICDI